MENKSIVRKIEDIVKSEHGSVCLMNPIYYRGQKFDVKKISENGMVEIVSYPKVELKNLVPEFTQLILDELINGNFL